MDTETILATARSGHAPSEWTIWPLRRDKVLKSGLQFLALGLLGTAILIPVALATIPDDFSQDSVRFVVVGVVLLLLATMAFGGLGIATYDFYRVANASRYLLVLTPDDFVLQTARRTVHVPMEDVQYLTLKGSKVTQRGPDPSATVAGMSSMTGIGRIFGLAGIGRKPREAPSLAFIDKRTGREVLVSRDNSFDELDALDEVLGMYVFNKERTRRTG